MLSKYKNILLFVNVNPISPCSFVLFLLPLIGEIIKYKTMYVSDYIVLC